MYIYREMYIYIHPHSHIHTHTQCMCLSPWMDVWGTSRRLHTGYRLFRGTSVSVQTVKEPDEQSISIGQKRLFAHGYILRGCDRTSLDLPGDEQNKLTRHWHQWILFYETSCLVIFSSLVLSLWHVFYSKYKRLDRTHRQRFPTYPFPTTIIFVCFVFSGCVLTKRARFYITQFFTRNRLFLSLIFCAYSISLLWSDLYIS